MRVVCVLLPHLPVALARRREPALRDRPLVVLDGPDPSPGRTRVLDASAEARAAGIAPGLRASEAAALLPAAALVPLDADLLAETDRALLTALLATCPAAEPAGPGAAFAALRGLGDLFGDEGGAAHRLAAARAATGLVPQVGVAEGTFPAAAAARTVLARLVAHPERRGRAARLLLVRVRCTGGTAWERRLPLRPPTADPDRLLARLRDVLTAVRPGEGLPGPAEVLELALAGLTGEAGVQGQLFGATARDRAALREAVRSLSARYGRSPILRIVAVAPWSRLPERRWGLGEFEG